MTHVYPPVMLKRIFVNDGVALIPEMAKDFVETDEGAVEMVSFDWKKSTLTEPDYDVTLNSCHK